MQIKKYLQPIINVMIILIITFFLIEVVFFTFLKFPNLNVTFPYLKNHVKNFYMSRDRDIIQLLPRCAVYDNELTYKLKEGSCVVKTREFVAKYDINKMGLRDDENSLQKPEMIVLGDSHAMGWGVDQDKIFSSLIEKNTKIKVLNAAISSYGTAREFLMLKRLDNSNLKYLVIQYCSNDAQENKKFVNGNYKLKNKTKEEYQKIVDEHINRTIYNPFGFTASIIEDVKDSIKKKKGGIMEDLDRNEVDNLLKIVNKINGVAGKDTKIILFEVNRNNENRKDFSDKVLKALDTEFPELKKKIIVIDSAKILQKKDYFILDDHMNKNGHEKIAKEILQAIEDN